MKDPAHLLDEGATTLELSLLRAGDGRGPSPAARQAAMAALGIGGAALASSSLAAAAGVKSSGLGAQLLTAKWWLIGVLSVGAGAGYVALSPPTALQAPHSGVASDRRPPAQPAAVTAEPSEAPAVVPHAADPATPPPSDTLSRDGAPTTATRAPASSGNASIQEQVALIDRARSAAAAGQHDQSLAALDEYQRRYPRGALGQDATMLRIEALLARGDKAGAQRLGQKFLERYPRSVLAARVRSLVGG